MTKKLVNGDLLLFKGNGFLSFLIKLFTGSEYTHVGVYVGKDNMVEAAYNGVVESSVKNKEFDVYRTTLTAIQKKEMVRFLKDKVGYGYDYFGLLGIALSILKKFKINFFDSKTRYWCSELAADAYAWVDISIDGVYKTTPLVSPGLLARSKLFKKIEE